MIEILIQIAFLIVAYILGSIPWALIVGKLVRGIDIREHGSKNMGATNTFRVLGFKWGLLVFALDAIKGGIIVLLMNLNIFNFNSDKVFILHPLCYGVFAFLGHLFPLFAKFKGGKGMATAAGIVLAFAPMVFSFGLVAFIITIITSRYVSLSSCVTCLVAVIVAILSPFRDNVFAILLTIVAIIIIIKHIPNLKRIINHTESKINFKSITNHNEDAFIIEEKK